MQLKLAREECFSQLDNFRATTHTVSVLLDAEVDVDPTHQYAVMQTGVWVRIRA